MRNEIILIGPMGVGKSSVSKKISEKLNKSHISIDEVRFKYYEEIGYDKITEECLKKEKGFMKGVYLYRKPYNLYAIKKILSEFSNCVFDFGFRMYHPVVKFANFVYSDSHANFTVPVSPLRCLEIIISATFLSSVSSL